MSKWLGLGSRTAPPPASPGKCRRSSSLETQETSRRSSLWQEDELEDGVPACIDAIDLTVVTDRQERGIRAASDGNNMGHRDSSGPLEGSGSSLDDWEVLGGSPMQPRDEARPMSPGVDFSVAYSAVDERASAGDEAESKWLDAGKIHNFLVRGPSYLVVSGGVLLLLREVKQHIYVQHVYVHPGRVQR